MLYCLKEENKADIRYLNICGDLNIYAFEISI